MVALNVYLPHIFNKRIIIWSVLTAVLAGLRRAERHERVHRVIVERLEDGARNQAALRVADQIDALRVGSADGHQVLAELVDLPPGVLQAGPAAEAIRVVDDGAGMGLR